MKRHIISGLDIVVSDGSYYTYKQVDACAWIVSSLNGKEPIQGGWVIPGETKNWVPIESK